MEGIEGVRREAARANELSAQARADLGVPLASRETHQANGAQLAEASDGIRDTSAELLQHLGAAAEALARLNAGNQQIEQLVRYFLPASEVTVLHTTAVGAQQQIGLLEKDALDPTRRAIQQQLAVAAKLKRMAAMLRNSADPSGAITALQAGSDVTTALIDTL